MGFGDTFKFYGYQSDNGGDYVVKLSAAIATVGGFAEVTDPLSEPGWPFGPSNMRHVWGVSAAGKRARIPLATNADSLYVAGGTFSLHGTSYKVEGAIGEARKLSELGG